MFYVFMYVLSMFKFQRHSELCYLLLLIKLLREAAFREEIPWEIARGTYPYRRVQ